MENENRNIFLKNSDYVIRGLQDTLSLAMEKRMRTEEGIKTLESLRKNMVRSHADKMLPNLEKKTLENLRSAFPKFVTKDVERIFAQARDIDVPFLVRLGGGSSAYRAEALSDGFGKMYVNLIARIGMLEIDLPDIREMDSRINSEKERYSLLTKQGEEVREKLRSLRDAHTAVSKNDAHAVKPQLVNMVRESAKKLKAARNEDSGSHSGDDDDDLMLLWATGIPSSMRTLFLSEMLYQHPAGGETFSGFGGGNAGGAGATEKWEEKTDGPPSPDPVAGAPLPMGTAVVGETLGSFS